MDVRLSPDPLGGAVANRLSIASQESYTINAVPQQGSDDENYHSPPPVPPRAPRRPRSLGMEMIDSARIDPDYSYIKDDREPAKVSVRGGRGQSVEKQLEDLEREIDEDNYKRKQRRMTMDAVHTTRKATSMYETSKSKTLMATRFSGSYAQQSTPVPKEASDYLEPVPSQRVQEKVGQLGRRLSPGEGEVDPVDALLQGLTETSPITRSLGPLISHKVKDHDYSTIPDKVLGSTIAPPPVHFRTTSADSTQSAPELPPRLRRSHGEKGAALFDDPPSPPSRMVLPVSPIRTASYQINLNSGGKVEEISPYATSRGLRIDAGIQSLQSLEPLPPPLPPRSPVKHQRERASMPSVGSRSSKPKQSVAKTQSLADSHIHMSYLSSLRSHTPNHTHKKDCGSLPDLCINSLDQTSQSSDGGGSNSSHGAVGVAFPTEDRSPTRPESLSSEGSTRQSSNDKESLNSALQELDEFMKELKDLDEDGSAQKDSQKRVLHNDIGAALMTTQQIQSDLLSAKGNRKTSPDQKTQINRSLSLATSPPPRTTALPTSNRRSLSSFKSTPTIAGNGKISPPGVGNGKISPPGVPPRSLVSLNNGMLHESTTPTSALRSLTPPNMASNSIHHASMHRYEKSNTVFIYHIRDQQPVRIAHKSLV